MAKNWKTCHNCADIRNKAISEALKELSEAYGKIPEKEYQRRKSRLGHGKYWEPDEDEEHINITYETLREDYEHYFENGKFVINYSASCDRCGFNFKYEEQENG